MPDTAPLNGWHALWPPDISDRPASARTHLFTNSQSLCSRRHMAVPVFPGWHISPPIEDIRADPNPCPMCLHYASLAISPYPPTVYASTDPKGHAKT